MARLGHAQQSPANEALQQDLGREDGDIDYNSVVEDENTLAHIINRASLSSSKGGEKVRSRSSETGGGSVFRGAVQSIQQMWGYRKQASAQKDQTGAVTHKTIEGRNINGSRKSAMVDDGGEEKLEMATDASPTPTARGTGTGKPNSTGLIRPSIVYADIGGHREKTAMSSKSNGRPSPYDIPASQENSEEQSSSEPVAKRRGRKPKTALIVKGSNDATAWSRTTVESAGRITNTEVPIEEDRHGHTERNNLNSKRARPASMREPSPPPKRMTRSKGSKALVEPTDYSVPVEKDVQRNPRQLTQKPGWWRKKDISEQRVESGGFESEEGMSSPAPTPGSRRVMEEEEEEDEWNEEENVDDELPDNTPTQYVQTSGAAQEAFEVNGVLMTPRHPKSPGTKNQKSGALLQPKERTRAAKTVPDSAKSKKTARKVTKNLPQEGKAAHEKMRHHEDKKKQRARVGNRQLVDHKTREKDMKDRAEAMRKDKHFKELRAAQGLPPPGSQQSHVSPRKQPPLPNSSRLRVPPSSQPFERRSSSPLFVPQSSNPIEDQSGSQVPDSQPCSPAPLPTRNRTPFVHPSKAYIAEQERMIEERTKEMQRKNTHLKQRRAEQGLPPIGSRQNMWRSMSHQASVSNSSQIRARSSRRSPDPFESPDQLLRRQANASSRRRSPDPFESPEPALSNGFDNTERPATGNRALQIQRELAALSEKERKLQQELREAMDATDQGEGPVDNNERVMMFGGGNSPASRPKQWGWDEMVILIEGLKDNRGPDRYEKIRLRLPDRNYDEIFDRARYFKDSMVERHKEKLLIDPNTPALEAYIENIGLESREPRVIV